MLINDSQARMICFHLPQYHPIPENDKWWGKGFTEWTSVTKAKPLFKDHYQPHLPADLGFYDLRLPEARQAQAELAKAYGIHGFCYYHYWFNGKRLLDRPVNEILASGEPDFPFCLCWANESWERRWNTVNKEILLEQVYSEEDDRHHIQWLAKAFQDSRYIRINGKPLFLVYRASQLPNPNRTAEIWREEAQRLGVGEVFLCKVESFQSEHGDPEKMGFDACVEFQPDWTMLGTPLNRERRKYYARKLGFGNKAYEDNKVFDYEATSKRMLAKPTPNYKRFPCVTPTWDNTARRLSGDATILHNSTPELYERWLRTVIERQTFNEADSRIVFINAWNEWGEGNHLEPCQKWGHAYLEATQRALSSVNNLITPTLALSQEV